MKALSCSTLTHTHTYNTHTPTHTLTYTHADGRHYGRQRAKDAFAMKYAQTQGQLEEHTHTHMHMMATHFHTQRKWQETCTAFTVCGEREREGSTKCSGQLLAYPCQSGSSKKKSVDTHAYTQTHTHMPALKMAT